MRKLCSEQLADRTHNVLRPTLGKMVIREVAATMAVMHSPYAFAVDPAS
jgi:hypothetical protein